MPEPRAPWACHWEFWAALTLAAVLRLWHLDVAQFTFGTDQAGFMTLARGAFRFGALPVTGIPSSIKTLNPPLSIYLAMPFTAFGPNPMPIVISIALCNVLGVGLCYILAYRYWGRGVAASATFLFATCGVAVDLSRFLWQQNYLPPLLALWGLALFVGCVRGQRFWLVPSVVLLVSGAMLHPTAALLAPVVLVALLLAPRAPRLWEYLASGVATVLLLVPTIIWEVVSHFDDLQRLRTVEGGHPVLNTQVGRMLFGVLGPPTYSGVGAFLPYAALSPSALYWSGVGGVSSLYPLVQGGVWALFTLGYVLLTVRVCAPLRHIHGAGPAAGGGWRRGLRTGAGWLAAARHGLRTDASWRAHLLLWLWLTSPVALMLRHSTPIYAHYLLVCYPAAFIIMGLAVRQLWRWAATFAPLAWRLPLALAAKRRQPVAGQMLVVALAAFLVAGQALQCVLYIASLERGQFVAASGYGYTLGAEQAAGDQLARMQRAQDASGIYLSTPLRDFQPALQYLLVGEHPDRDGFAGDCLLLPGSQAGRTLVVATDPGGHAGALLAQLPNARQVGSVPMPGGTPFAVYQVAGQTPRLSGETPVAPVTFRDPSGAGLRLDAAAPAGSGALRLRWTVLGSTPPGASPQQYQVRLRAPGPDGAAGADLATGACLPTRWQAGQTVFTWLTAPAVAGGAALTTGAVAVQVWASTSSLWMPTLGPLRLLADKAVDTPSTRLSPALTPTPATSGTPMRGGMTASGEFTLPLEGWTSD